MNTATEKHSKAFNNGRAARRNDGNGVVKNPSVNPNVGATARFEWFKGYAHEDQLIGLSLKKGKGQ